MNNCIISVYLAYIMAIYSAASVYYLLRSRSVGTPFADSLTPEQRIIKTESARVRKSIFTEGLLLSIAFMLFTKPFKKCA